jgi:hypothetical protein
VLPRFFFDKTCRERKKKYRSEMEQKINDRGVYIKKSLFVFETKKRQSLKGACNTFTRSHSRKFERV